MSRSPQSTPDQGGSEPQVDLSVARETARRLAVEWGLVLEEPFAMSNVSFVAPTTDERVLKVAWEGDDEAIHEAAALELWNGRGAVRVLRHERFAVLEERVRPGGDISGLAESRALAVALELAPLLWRPAQAPFRSVEGFVRGWLDEAERRGSELVGLARELFAEVGVDPSWVVHGDLHHHNIIEGPHGYVAIDPKPFLADREYDVPSFLWNPMDNRLEDREQTEGRIAAFVSLGLDEFKIRAWSVIRGSYLRTDPDYVRALRALIA